MTEPLERERQEATRLLAVVDGQRARLARLEGGSNNEARSYGFQAGVQLLATAVGPGGAAAAAFLRLPCPIGARSPAGCRLATAAGVLHRFGEYVARAFADSRAAHVSRKSGRLCPPPEYQGLGVDAVRNVELADRFRHGVQARVKEQTGAGHAYTAWQVAKPYPALRLLGLGGGDLGWLNEGVLLGWHGASDGAVEEILADGFNPCCVGEGSGGLFGRGFYFAANSSKADLYAGPLDRRFRRHKERMTVILAAVNCGNMYEAKATGQQWKKPPPPDAAAQAAGIKRCSQRTLVFFGTIWVELIFCQYALNLWRELAYSVLIWSRFHSALGQTRARGGVVDHHEYIVFDKAQALPIATVTYSHKANCQC